MQTTGNMPIFRKVAFKYRPTQVGYKVEMQKQIAELLRAGIRPGLSDTP
jgi:hypothetical protein